MKSFTKLSYAVAMSLALINVSQANIKPYIGLDASTTKIESSDNSKEITSGLTAGFKFNLDEKFFIAPEVYYNFIDKVSEYNEEELNYSYLKEDSNLYGARVNFGYNINEKLNATVFGGVGFFKWEFEENYFGNILSEKSTDTQGLLLGFGLGYNINENFEVKFNYEYQKIDHHEFDADAHQYKIGLNYNF